MVLTKGERKKIIAKRKVKAVYEARAKIFSVLLTPSILEY